MSDYPLNYQLQNDNSTKYLNIVVEFEGTDQKFSLLPTFKRVKWGDPDLHFGDPGLAWGGLVQMPDVNPIISPNTSLTISQVIEPEQGRASAAMMSIEFIDVQGFMTNFVAPGKYVNEVLGGKLVKIYLGYQNTSFKADYFVIYRGYVSKISTLPTKVVLQLTDANLKRRQQIFKLGKTQLRQFNYSFLPGDVNIVADTITINSHDFENGNKIQLFTTGSLPSPLAAATDYYIVNKTTNTFQLATTVGGSAIDLTSSGSGTHSIYLYGVGPLAQRIPVVSNAEFVQAILGPNGGYDTSLKTYVKVDNEIMLYSPTGLATPLWITVVRGQRSTVAADHDTTGQNAVDNLLELEDNLIDSCLKLMLSGWAGTWIDTQTILKFVQTDDPTVGNISNGLILPTDKDANVDYGLSVGDYLYITGATNPGNNGTKIITGFLDLTGRPNAVILVDSDFVIETTTSAVFASRSQYDTLPVDCGSKLRPIDVDVAQWQSIKQNFLGTPDCIFRTFVTSPQAGKDFIEKTYLLPSGSYSVTRFGRLSAVVTKPPQAGDNLVILNEDTVIDPQNIQVERGLNIRRFFNEVQYSYDFDDQGNSTNKLIALDTDSLENTQTSSVLPIEAQGLRTDHNATTFINKRVSYILKRFKDAATQITMKTNWRAASLVEVSDIVALYDNGNLKITNLQNGTRDMGSQLFEVIQRSIDVKSGTGTMTLLSQPDYQITDRFAGIAPSSLVDVGSSTTEVIIKDSFGKKYPFNEKKKWEPIIGERIRVHSPDYTYDHVVTLFDFQSGSAYRMLVSPALPSPPLAGYIVDCDVYPDNANANDQVKSKLLFSFIDPTLTVVSGISTTQFTVSPTDANNIFPGLPVKIHNQSYSIESAESIVDTVVGTTVTLRTAIAFTPSAGQKIELIGFRDGSGPYRIL